MHKKQIHSSKNQPSDGAQLALWLNAGTWSEEGGLWVDEEEKRSITHLLGLILEFARQVGIDYRSPKLKMGNVAIAAINELRARHQEHMQEINAILGRYAWTTSIVSVDDRGAAFFAEHRSYAKDSDGKLRDSRMGYIPVRCIIRLGASGSLARVRECKNCGIWFFATREKQQFHSVECQQKHWRATPEFKANNRTYQRNYYRDQLSPVTRRIKAKARR